MLRIAYLAVVVVVVSLLSSLVSAQPGGGALWPHWRGPAHTGATTANVPLTWSDTQNVKWKIEIPGRGFSTPVIVGDRLFLTTAIPTGKKEAPAGGGGRAGGGAGAG